MKADSTALILIGYQNDYFANDGTLADFIDDRERVQEVRDRTMPLIEKCIEQGVLVVSTPILFTETYDEVRNPIGILAAIKERGAFRRGQPGSAVIADFDRFGDKIVTVPGKRGLDAFSHTSLSDTLAERNIDHIAIAGVVTSLCIDSTGRAGFEAGREKIDADVDLPDLYVWHCAAPPFFRFHGSWRRGAGAPARGALRGAKSA